MKDFSFRFLVADEGIKVDFVQASPTEVVFKISLADSTANTKEDNANMVVETNTPESLDVDNVDVISESANVSTDRSRIDKELLVKLWNDGLHAKEIAKRLGTTESTVYTYAGKLGCDKRKSNPVVDNERFKEMWNAGCKVNDIAAEFKISYATVYRWVKKIPGCIARTETPVEQTTAIPEPIAQSKVSSKENYPKSGEHLREPEIKALCNMWDSGQRNVAELARYFGVSRNTIYYQLRVNGCRR